MSRKIYRVSLLRIIKNLLFIYRQNVTVGTPIIQVEAQDADTGLNGQVHYRLKQDLAGHWRTFHIDEKTGVITTKVSLDRETQRLYEASIDRTHTTSYNPIFVLEFFVIDFYSFGFTDSNRSSRYGNTDTLELRFGSYNLRS